MNPTNAQLACNIHPAPAQPSWSSCLTSGRWKRRTQAHQGISLVSNSTGSSLVEGMGLSSSSLRRAISAAGGAAAGQHRHRHTQARTHIRMSFGALWGLNLGPMRSVCRRKWLVRQQQPSHPGLASGEVCCSMATCQVCALMLRVHWMQHKRPASSFPCSHQHSRPEGTSTDNRGAPSMHSRSHSCR